MLDDRPENRPATPMIATTHHFLRFWKTWKGGGGGDGSGSSAVVSLSTVAVLLVFSQRLAALESVVLEVGCGSSWWWWTAAVWAGPGLVVCGSMFLSQHGGVFWCRGKRGWEGVLVGGGWWFWLRKKKSRPWPWGGGWPRAEVGVRRSVSIGILPPNSSLQSIGQMA